MILLYILPILASATILLKSSDKYRHNTFEPPKTIFANFAATNDENLLTAKMKMNTSKPTIKLSTLLDIVNSVNCAESILTIGFIDLNNTMEAYRHWSNITDLVFLIEETHGCNGDDFAAVMTSGLSISTESLSIQSPYILVGMEEVVEEWSATITERPMAPALFKQKTVNLNFNLSHYFFAMGQPGFTIFDHDLIHFQNCYTNGSIKFTIELHGHRRKLLSYRMAMEGQFNANAEVKLGILPNQEITLFRTNVLTIPLTPWSIPGILTIGPSFGIEIGLYGFSDTELSVELGFDYHLPIHFEMASSDLKTIPDHKITDKTRFNAHPPKYVIGSPPPTAIGGFIDLSPNIAFGVTILGTDLVEISGGFHNEFGVIHRFGNGTFCPEKRNSVELFLRTIIGAALTVWPAEWNWSFYDSGRRLMYISCKEDIGRFNETANLPTSIP